MDAPLSFSRWLKHLRTAHDWSQEALAEQTGCSAETIRAIEGARRRPSRAMAERLADVLEVAPEQRVAFLGAARSIDESGSGQLATPLAAHDAPPVSTAHRMARLQVPPTVLIGRATEVAYVCRRLIDPACRLVTVLGPGGMGKTRLAVQAAEELGPHFANGVLFVALAPLNAPEHVATTIAAACGCPLTPTRSADDTLLDYLRSRELLLVLDNMEHLLPATSLVAAILREAPAVKLLVTSRERLRLHGEHSFELGSLALPRDDTRDAIERSEAVLLFVERAPGRACFCAHAGQAWHRSAYLSSAGRHAVGT